MEKVLSEQYVMRLVFTWAVVKDLSYFEVVLDWQYWLSSLIYKTPASLISWRLSTVLLYSWPHKNVLSKNSPQMNRAFQSDSALKWRAFTQQSSFTSFCYFRHLGFLLLPQHTLWLLSRNDFSFVVSCSVACDSVCWWSQSIVFSAKKKILSPQLKSNPAFSQHFQVLRSSPTFSWISDFLFSSFFNISLKSTGAPFQHQLFPVFSLFAALLFGQRANLGLAM